LLSNAVNDLSLRSSLELNVPDAQSKLVPRASKRAISPIVLTGERYGERRQLLLQLRRDVRHDDCRVTIVTKFEHVTDAMNFGNQA
jgi:hypothetical protein